MPFPALFDNVFSGNLVLTLWKIALLFNEFSWRHFVFFLMEMYSIRGGGVQERRFSSALLLSILCADSTVV